MKGVFKGIVFVLCAALVITTAFGILAPKGGSGIYDMKTLYSLRKDSVDVLLLGSSLSFINLDPAVMWKERGIAAYCLGGAIQPIWNSYYYLKEALRYQKPTVAALDVFCARYSNEYSEGSYKLNNVVAIRSPINRLNAVKSAIKKADRLSVFLGWPDYHSRYAELSRDDFLPYRGRTEFEYYLGHGTYFKTERCERPNPYAPVEPVPLSEKNEDYLLRIIDLCRENGVSLLLFASPTAQYSEVKGYYQTVAEIACQNGVPFVDFNYLYDEMQLDFSQDFADANHLNQYGEPKFSSVFGGYLKSEYNLPDRRGQDGYARWDNAQKLFERSLYDYEISIQTDMAELIEKIRRCPYNNLSAFISVSETANQAELDALRESGLDASAGVYMLRGGGAARLENDELPYCFDLGFDSFSVSSNGIKKEHSELFFADNGVWIAVFDEFTEKPVDMVVFSHSGVERPVSIVRSWVGAGD